MRRSSRSRAKRIAAGILALTALVVLLFTAFYPAAEADHDCEGEDCPICACIRQCAAILRGIGDGAEMVQPVAIVCIGGLLYATIMTLVIIPVIYDIFNRKNLRTIREEELTVLDI